MRLSTSSPENWKAPAPQSWPALSALPFGRVHIAFFARDTDDQTPDYEIGMRYYANGVADALTMNFGDFSMTGKLDRFDLKPPAHC